MKIKRLVLFTSQIQKQEDFYTNQLGFSLRHSENDELCYRVGNTELIFRYKAKSKPYHFAFNIPSNSIDKALRWLKGITTILTDEGNEIQNFDSWKAKAVYCYDADKNIIEFIARERISVNSKDTFSADSVLSVSEIGVVSEDNLKITNYLQDNYSLPLFAGTKEVFAALGDDNGLFISMDKTKRNWFPTGEEAFCSDFEIEFIADDQLFSLDYSNGNLIQK